MSGAAIYSIDADDSGDIVAAKYDSNVVSVLHSNGIFSSGPRLPVGPNPSAVTSEDLDGVEDLAVSNFASDNVSVLWGPGSGGFQSAQNFPAGDGPAFVIGARLNGDGFPDLAVANQNSNNVSVLLNTAQDHHATHDRLRLSAKRGHGHCPHDQRGSYLLRSDGSGHARFQYLHAEETELFDHGCGHGELRSQYQ